MKKLLYVLTGLCLLAGIFTGCEKESEKAKSTIKGVVIDKETGSPLSGVIMTLQPTGTCVQTAQDGTYSFENLKAGTYTLKAQKNGYNEYETGEIQLGAAQALTLDIEMGESICALEGKVTDKETGKPLSDVVIELQPMGKQVQTAEDGTYILDSLKAGTYALKAQKEGYVDYIKESIKLIASQTLSLDIEMEEPFVEFQITDEEGNPIEKLECYGTESGFKLLNVGNMAGEWSIGIDADWITEISPKNGNLEAGASEIIRFKRALLEEDKETVVTIKNNKEDLHLTVINKGFVMDLVYVEGGTFSMGATEEQGDDAFYFYYEKPVHSVTLDGFYMGKYEVTQAQWKAVMGTAPSYFKGDNLPVEQVSWNEAVQFCEKLSQMTGKTYRLPTEAEWEYAARGGNKSQHYKYAGGNDIDEVAWYDRNSGDMSHPVGIKKANELGIYDMSGNVWEWCSDWFEENYYIYSPTVNPQGPVNGYRRVSRGGSRSNSAVYCRVSFRIGDTPSNRYDFLGFRVACSSK